MGGLNRQIEDQDKLTDCISLKNGFSRDVQQLLRLLQCSLSLSLSLSLKPESHLLRVKSSIYPLGSSLSSCSLSCWMLEGTSSIKHFFPYLERLLWVFLLSRSFTIQCG